MRKRTDWRISDHRTILMNLINRRRLEADINTKFLDETEAQALINRYAKQNKLTTLEATDALIKKVRSGELVL